MVIPNYLLKFQGFGQNTRAWGGHPPAVCGRHPLRARRGHERGQPAEGYHPFSGTITSSIGASEQHDAVYMIEPPDGGFSYSELTTSVFWRKPIDE